MLEQVLHYHRIEGTPGKFNDVYVSEPATTEDIQRLVVFFPGDVQECFEDMSKRRDTRYKEYCFENCAQWLHEKFQSSCVSIVKSCRMHLNMFACYDNFLSSNEFGIPSYSASGVGTWYHLKALLNNIMTTVDLKEKRKEVFSVTLVSFSKGCVVLNQLLHELPGLTHQERTDLLSNIDMMCWLDSGVPGTSGAYLINELCVQVAAEHIAQFEVHTTPYQMRDTLRPWILKEKKRFVQLLRKYKARCAAQHYFEDEVAGLETHFKLVKQFRPSSSSS